MKKFNASITINVEVDAIAEQLLGMMKEDEKHKEIVTEAIIGILMHKDRLSPLYNTMRGHSLEVNWKVGDKIMCSERVYDYKGQKKSEDGKSLNSEYREIGECVVYDVDVYRDNPISVEFTKINRNLEEEIDWKQVSATSCSKIPVNMNAKENGKTVKA